MEWPKMDCRSGSAGTKPGRHRRVRRKAQVRVGVLGRRGYADRLEHEGAGSLGHGELDGDDRAAVRFELARAISVDRLLDSNFITGRLSWVGGPSSILCRRCRYKARYAAEHRCAD